MNKQTEALKLALEGAANYIDALGGDSRKYRQALAEQPAQQEPVAWRYDLKRGGSFEGVSTEYSRVKLSIGENWIPLYTSPPAQQQQEPEPDRVKFERHWRKTRGEKKANRELPRHPLQPQTYIQDSANRHWVTWQAAVKSVASTAQRKPWVGLTDEERGQAINANFGTGLWAMAKDIEAKLREKNT